MKIEIDSSPSYGMAIVTLEKGETVIAETGSMVAMSTAITADPQLSGAGKGGPVEFIKALLFALARRFMAGESVFVNHFTAKQDAQEVMISPAMVGDVKHIELDGTTTYTVQAGSWLASSKDVWSELVWGGFSMLFGGEGAFFLKCGGKGDLLINCYGGLEKVEVNGKYVVDTGHVVAWEGKLKHRIKRAGGWKATLLSGEGLVLEFEGEGIIWLQTRNISSLVSWITPFLPS